MAAYWVASMTVKVLPCGRASGPGGGFRNGQRVKASCGEQEAVEARGVVGAGPEVSWQGGDSSEGSR